MTTEKTKLAKKGSLILQIGIPAETVQDFTGDVLMLQKELEIVIDKFNNKTGKLRDERKKMADKLSTEEKVTLLEKPKKGGK